MTGDMQSVQKMKDLFLCKIKAPHSSANVASCGSNLEQLAFAPHGHSKPLVSESRPFDRSIVHGR